jgi:hypothetical protein
MCPLYLLWDDDECRFAVDSKIITVFLAGKHEF